MRISPPLYREQTEGKEQCIPVECNCSYCERNGYIGVHPLAKDVEFTQGTEFIEKYYTAQKKNPMWFCRKCASVLITDLTNLMEEVFHTENRYTVNVSDSISVELVVLGFADSVEVRMLKDFDPDKLQTRRVTVSTYIQARKAVQRL